MAANIAAAHPNVGARIVAAWPALARLLVFEILTRNRLAALDDAHGVNQTPWPAARLPVGGHEARVDLVVLV
jgi:hypothetical protein